MSCRLLNLETGFRSSESRVLQELNRGHENAPRRQTRRWTAVGSRPSRSQTQRKLPTFVFDDRNQARALLCKGVSVAVRSSSARLMTANHKLRSLSVMITERDIAQERGKKEGIYEPGSAADGENVIESSFMGLTRTKG